MAQITAKTSKKGLIDFIIEQAARIVDENLQSRVNYTLKALQKDESKVTKTDLYELAKEILSLPAPTPAKAPVENSPKPKLGKKTSVKEKIAEVEAEDAEAEAEEEVPETPKETKKAPKKPAKKAAVKETPKPKVETADGLTKKDLPMARIFPKEFEHEALGKLVACPDKYKTMKEVREALNEGVILVFATYWTKRHLKEFAYAQVHDVPVPKTGFPNDLDMLQVLYPCDGFEAVYALSTYTEAMFRFNDSDLARVECESNTGEKFTMRYSAGLEFEIYEAVDAKAAE